ncbi:MAG: FecR domain-containing protein [Verrucomicrobia bacterium]|nr:FecR domain-containing protein [Verrucomicrobiota bacterium]
MRLNKLFAWFLCCAVAALLAASSASAQDKTRVPGHIVAAKVTGTVTATNTTDKKTAELKTNDILFQNYVINTGANSSVILVFSNGATLNIGAESSLSIDEYLQDPLDKELALSDLKEEPNSSVTKLNLTRGELVGNVKHLHEDRGSSFTVNTPVGAAGIRGTTFRIVFHPDSTGKIFFTLSTAEGRVLLSGQAPASGAAAQEIASVSTGKEVVINVDATVDPVTNAVTIKAPAQPTGTTDIPAATQATIAAAAQQISDISTKVIISSTQQAAADAAAAKAAADAAAAKAAADKAAADAAAAKDAQEKADKEAAAKKAQEAADKAKADADAAAKAAADAKATADAAALAAQQALQQQQQQSTVPSSNTPTTQSDPLAGGSGG